MRSCDNSWTAGTPMLCADMYRQQHEGLRFIYICLQRLNSEAFPFGDVISIRTRQWFQKPS